MHVAVQSQTLDHRKKLLLSLWWAAEVSIVLWYKILRPEDERNRYLHRRQGKGSENYKAPTLSHEQDSENLHECISKR
jgi:hypothetical protein